MKILKVSGEKGQSLVEMAITAPLLIFFVLGIFEVGAAIRNYLTLVNINREITRFAVRPGYIDFSTEDSVDASYQRILDWANSSISGQLGLDFDNATGSTTLVVTHMVIDTGLPCKDIHTNPNGCNCNAFQPGVTYTNTFTLDDLIIHPNVIGQGYQTRRFGPASTVTGSRATHLNYSSLAAQMVAKNNNFNCEIIKKGGIPSSNNVIVTELFHDQPQLFGFPLISNPFTDPVPLYTHTMMRLVTAARSTANLQINNDTVGYNICTVYPIAVRDTTIEFGTSNKIDQVVDILNGDGDPHFGWFTWNPAHSTGSSSTSYLENELNYPVSPLNDFTHATVSTDHTLNVGDYVASMQDRKNVTAISDALSLLVGREIRIPVWDTFNGSAYHIAGFARVRIESPTDIDLATGTISARYLAPDDTCN